MGKASKSVSTSKDSAIKYLIQQGETNAQIAIQLDVCPRRVAAARKGLKNPSDARAIRYPEAFKRAVADCRNAGMTYSRIDRIFGVKDGAAHKWALQYKPCQVCGTMPSACTHTATA